MSMSRILVIVATMALGSPWLAASQMPPSGPPAGGTQMVRAAGMPLQDGELPPGSLTVRVVQGAFTANLSGIPVEVQVTGQPSLRAQTGALGRAEFAHLPIGVEARATAVVNGERLESESFRVPAESGLRVLLITGGETAGHGTGGALPVPPPAEPGVPAAIPLASLTQPGAQNEGVRIVQASVVLLTVLTFAAVFVRQRRRPR